MIRELTLNPLCLSPLWFEPRSGDMWETQVLLTEGKVFFYPGFSGLRSLLMNSDLRSLLMNDRLDISEIFLKGP